MLQGDGWPLAHARQSRRAAVATRARSAAQRIKAGEFSRNGPPRPDLSNKQVQRVVPDQPVRALLRPAEIKWPSSGFLCPPASILNEYDALKVGGAEGTEERNEGWLRPKWLRPRRCSVKEDMCAYPSEAPPPPNGKQSGQALPVAAKIGASRRPGASGRRPRVAGSETRRCHFRRQSRRAAGARQRPPFPSLARDGPVRSARHVPAAATVSHLRGAVARHGPGDAAPRVSSITHVRYPRWAVQKNQHEPYRAAVGPHAGGPRSR